MLDKLILKWGLPKLIGGALLALLLLGFGAKFFVWPSIKAWYYENKVEKLEQKLEVSKTETKVARKDEAQVTKSAEITADTIAKQDDHAAENRAATDTATKVIYERIEAAPVVVPVPDDPVVRNAAAEAYARAKAAQGRLRGTPSG